MAKSSKNKASDEMQAPGIREACEAYGIEEEYLLDAVVREETVTLITAGGFKVTWSQGMEVSPLTRIQITGINPENAKRKPITGGKR